MGNSFLQELQLPHPQVSEQNPSPLRALPSARRLPRSHLLCSRGLTAPGLCSAAHPTLTAEAEKALSGCSSFHLAERLHKPLWGPKQPAGNGDAGQGRERCNGTGRSTGREQVQALSGDWEGELRGGDSCGLSGKQVRWPCCLGIGSAETRYNHSIRISKVLRIPKLLCKQKGVDTGARNSVMS